VEYGGYVWGSVDSGVSWTKLTSTARNWISIVSSYDGSHLAAAESGADIWTSDDGGATWIDNKGAGARNWSSVASDASGTRLAAVVKFGDVWTGFAPQ
jgi:hypothetical protein